MRALIALLVLAFPLCAAPVPKSLQPKAPDERLIGNWEMASDSFGGWGVSLRLASDGTCSSYMHSREEITIGIPTRGKYTATAANGSSKYPVLQLSLTAHSCVRGEWSVLDIDDETLRLSRPADGKEVEFRRMKE